VDWSGQDTGRSQTGLDRVLDMATAKAQDWAGQNRAGCRTYQQLKARH